MKKIIINLFNFTITLYVFFYLGLFITDYSFIFKKSLSNITGFTVLLLILLLSRWFLDKKTFLQLPFVKKIISIKRLSNKTLLLIIFLLIVSIISVLGIVRHLSFSTMAWDMGLFDQALWNTLRGDVLFCSIRGNLSLLGDHFEPILFFIVPFYYIFPHVFTLIVLQSLILGSSVFPLYLLARERLNNRLLIFSLVISFILCKGLRGIGLSDFHPEAFMVPLSFLSFYFLIKKRNALFLLTVFVLLLCKETAVFIVFGIGVYILFALRRRMLGLSLFFAAASVWFLETKLFLPAFNVHKSYLFMVRMPFGDTYRENFLFILKNPLKFLSFIFMPQKLTYCLKLLGQAGFLSLFSPSHCLLTAFPLLTIILGSTAHSGYYLLSSHYVGHVLAFVYISAIYGAGRLVDKLKLSLRKQVLLALYLIAMSLFFYGKTDAYKFRKFISGMRENNYKEKISFLSLIPREASVAASSNLIPHLSHRKYIYDWNPESAISLATDYIVVDLKFVGYLSDAAKEKIPGFFIDAQNKGYKKIFANPENTFFIYHNPNNDNSYIRNFRGNLGI